MELVPYKKFYDSENVIQLAAFLNENGVPCSITEDRENLEAIYGKKTFKQQYTLNIKKADFEKAEELLLSQSRRQLETIDENHYLFSFTDQELYEILTKPDEWLEFDVLLAQKILKDRGNPVEEATVDRLKKERIQELAKPEKENAVWIFLGYFFAFMGGLLGIFIGWQLRTYKKTLPNGERIYGYSMEYRNHGDRIVMIGIIMMIVWLTINFMIHTD